jgi:hypothetical protein
MNGLAERIHRTWIEYLLAANLREVAALVADAELSEMGDNFGGVHGLEVDLTPSAAVFVSGNHKYKEIIENTLVVVSQGHFFDQNGQTIEQPRFKFCVRLMDTEENWRDIVKDLIANANDPNQGVVTERAFARRSLQPYLYNEMKFASQSEIRIAQELERRKVLFFPLPLAVRSDTGNMFDDHREVDFLICENGAWGILEVAYHPDRYEQDKEKDAWFKRSGILCIEHYTAERCYHESDTVVDEFLSILSKHRR